jgi:hypothetical protein
MSDFTAPFVVDQTPKKSSMPSTTFVDGGAKTSKATASRLATNLRIASGTSTIFVQTPGAPSYTAACPSSSRQARDSRTVRPSEHTATMSA